MAAERTYSVTRIRSSNSGNVLLEEGFQGLMLDAVGCLERLDLCQDLGLCLSLDQDLVPLPQTDSCEWQDSGDSW